MIHTYVQAARLADEYDRHAKAIETQLKLNASAVAPVAIVEFENFSREKAPKKPIAAPEERPTAAKRKEQ